LCLERRTLPSAKDKDPEWREMAVFDLGEVSTLIYDAAIPEGPPRLLRAVLSRLHALRRGRGAALASLRTERRAARAPRIARSYSTRLKAEKDTKAERPRRVRVTPKPAAILADWRLRGWPALFGRKAEGRSSSTARRCPMSETHAPVYVVDDDLSMRESLASLIRSAGLPVETFGSAADFLVRSRP
jgi:hypothetical protein